MPPHRISQRRTPASGLQSEIPFSLAPNPIGQGPRVIQQRSSDSDSGPLDKQASPLSSSPQPNLTSPLSNQRLPPGPHFAANTSRPSQNPTPLKANHGETAQVDGVGVHANGNVAEGGCARESADFPRTGTPYTSMNGAALGHSQAPTYNVQDYLAPSDSPPQAAVTLATSYLQFFTTGDMNMLPVDSNAFNMFSYQAASLQSLQVEQNVSEEDMLSLEDIFNEEALHGLSRTSSNRSIFPDGDSQPEVSFTQDLAAHSIDLYAEPPSGSTTSPIKSDSPSPTVRERTVFPDLPAQVDTPRVHFDDQASMTAPPRLSTLPALPAAFTNQHQVEEIERLLNSLVPLAAPSSLQPLGLPALSVYSVPSIPFPSLPTDAYPTQQPPTPTPEPTPTPSERPTAPIPRRYGAAPPIIPLDAPIQTRHYRGESATSRRPVPKAFANKMAPEQVAGVKRLAAVNERPGNKKAKVEVPPEVTPEVVEQFDAIEKKRRQNTIAARKSRARRREEQAGLEARLEEMSERADQEAAERAAVERHLDAVLEENARLKAALVARGGY